LAATNFLQLSELAEDLALAYRHVTEGRRILDRQRDVIAKKKAAGLEGEISEQLLAQFEISQRLFEQHLAIMLREATDRR